MNWKPALIFFLALLSAELLAQQLIFRPVDAFEEIRFTSMAQADDGVVWLTDAKALYSYNGYDFERAFERPLSGGVNTVLPHAGVTYLGTDQGVVYRWDGHRLDSILSFDGAAVKRLIALSEGGLLVATDGKGVYSFSDSGADPQGYGDIDLLDHVNDMLEAEGRLYFATDEGLFVEGLGQSGEEFQQMDKVGKRVINSLSCCGGKLWAGGYDGRIHRLDLEREGESTTELDVNGRVKDLECVGQTLVIGTDKGVTHYDAGLGMSKMETTFSTGPYQVMLADDEGDVWVGSENEMAYASLYFSRLTAPMSAQFHSADYSDDLLYLGSDKGLICWDPILDERLDLWGGVNITSSDLREGTLAAGSYDSGLWIGDAEAHTVLTTAQGLADNTVLAVAFSSEADLVVSTLAGVDHLTLKNGRWQVVERFPALDTYYILSIYVDGSALWFGTDKKGVVRYEQGRVQRLDSTVDGRGTGSIYSICRSGDGEMYMTSEHAGLLRQLEGELVEVTSPQGRWDRYSSVIPLDSGGVLLIGENEVSTYYPDREEMLEFSKELGLERGVSFLNNYCELKEGILFEHNSDLYIYHDLSRYGRSHSLTSLTSVEVDLKAIDTAIHRFTEDQNNFNFHFHGVLQRNPDRLSYSYRLLGFDTDWRHTEDRQASYPQLDPGQYEFQVRSAHDRVTTDTRTVSYAFAIRPLFYNTWLFRAILALAALALILWFAARQRKEKALRDRLALLSTESQLLHLKNQLNPHFLFNSFNTVIGLIEEDTDRSIQYVEHLTDFYRQVLETGERELIPLNKELALLETYLRLLEERFGTAVDVQVTGPFSHSLIPPMSLQLLVENAVKHNVLKATDPLTIHIKEEKGQLQVSNPLKVRASSKESMGIGLTNLRQRYALLAKKKIMVIESEEEFVVRLPIIQKGRMSQDP